MASLDKNFHLPSKIADLPTLLCSAADFPLGSESLCSGIREAVRNACKAQGRQSTPLIEERSLLDLQASRVLKELGYKVGAWEFFQQNVLQGIKEVASTEVSLKCFLGCVAKRLGKEVVAELVTQLLDVEAYDWFLKEGDRWDVSFLSHTPLSPSSEPAGNLDSCPPTPIKRALVHAAVTEGIWTSPAMTVQVPEDMPSLLATSASYELFLNTPFDYSP